MANAAQDPSNTVNEDKKLLPKTAFLMLSENLANHSTAVGGAVSTAVIAGANQLVDNVSFKCPCLSENETDTSFTSRRPLYGYLFVFGPAVFLLCVGIFLNRIFWEKLACSCKIVCAQCTCWKMKCKKWESCSCPSRSCDCFSLGYGAAAFFIWVLISLVDGDFIACAHTDCASRDPMVDECQCETLRTSDEYAEKFRWSQTSGWIIAVLSSLVALLVYVCYKCITCAEHPDDDERHERHQDKLAKAFADSIKTEGQPDEDLKAYVKELNDSSSLRKEFWSGLWDKLSDETSETSQPGANNPSNENQDQRDLSAHNSGYRETDGTSLNQAQDVEAQGGNTSPKKVQSSSV